MKPDNGDENREFDEVARRFPKLGKKDLRAVLVTLGDTVRTVLAKRFQANLSENDLDDVLGIALLRLWANRRHFDAKKGPLQAWFYVIARNAAFDVLRDRARHQALNIDHLEIRKCDLKAEDHAPTKLVHDLYTALSLLPERDRLILLAFARHRDGGRWAADFAQEHGLAAAHVRVLRYRAMEKIRHAMRQLGHEPLPP